MKSKIKITATILIVMLVASLALAQEDERPGKANREKVKAYIEENILPVATEERQDFEVMLTDAEKAKIQELRQRHEALREQRQSNRAAFRGRGDKDSSIPEPTDEQIAEMRLMRKEQRLIATEAFEIIDDHEDFFLAMESDLKEETAKWRADIKAIIEEGRPDGENQQFGDRRGKGHHRGRHGRLRQGMRFEKMFAPVAFLLMDPDNPKLGEESQEITVYPNPTAGKQTIAINLPEPSIVKVELIDSDGKILKTLFNGNLNKGSNDLSVDLTGLDGQQYFYKITTPNGTDTKRVLLK
ncbi:MAG: T9SS type A sorting domain-containing protein [Bacteroidota bacterium]